MYSFYRVKSWDFRNLEKQLKDDKKKKTYSDTVRTTPSPHTQPPTHPFLPHPPGNSCQLAPVHPFLLNTMQGRKHLPSLLKTNQPTGLPCWAKNFQAKFLMFRGLSSQSVSQLAGSRKVTPCQHLCNCTLSQYAALDCCAEKQKQKKKHCVITVSSPRCGLHHVWWTESMDPKISVTLYFSRSPPPASHEVLLVWGLFSPHTVFSCLFTCNFRNTWAWWFYAVTTWDGKM